MSKVDTAGIRKQLIQLFASNGFARIVERLGMSDLPEVMTAEPDSCITCSECGTKVIRYLALSPIKASVPTIVCADPKACRGRINAETERQIAVTKDRNEQRASDLLKHVTWQ